MAYDNGIGRKPPIGWNSWCTGDGILKPSLCNLAGRDPCSESEVKSIADAMVEQGLRDIGYEYVVLDDCWSDTERDANGELQPESKKFPSGMKHLSDYVHQKGLKFGLYTSVGDETCKGKRPGSFGHYETDANTLAKWGIDFVKMDHCGNKGNFSDQDLYGEMSKALNKTGRPILFSLCNWGEQNVWEWGGDIAQMFRIQRDHLPFWSWTKGDADDDEAGYGQGTKEIIEWMAALEPSKWTREYGYLDPDFLMTLYWPTMDYTKSRTEFSFWAIWSSPLLVSTDLRDLSKEKREILMNPEVIAVNQDESFTAGDRIRNNTDGGQLWTRTMSGGDVVALLYNSHDSNEVTVRCEWDADLGWTGGNRTASVRDLWNRKDLGNFTGAFSATVKPRDVTMVRIRDAGNV